jgi:tRNA threonylcarbamoyladenosine biosynthesis protein TsaE
MPHPWPHALALLDPAATAALGTKLAALLRPGDVVALHGDLGTGKTTLARALIQSRLGTQTPVPSPTFTLMQHYTTPHDSIVHCDLYRLKHPDELVELGWDDALADSIMLVEWPEHAGQYLPQYALHCALTPTPEGSRLATFSGIIAWSDRLRSIF